MFEQPERTPESARRPSAGSLLARAGLGGVPRGAVAGCVALVLAAIVLAGWRLGGATAGGEFAYESSGGAGGGEETAEMGSAEEGAGSGDPDAAKTAALWVHVAGAVRTPGLYELPSGSRVGDALTVAGGMLEDAAVDAINLARLLDDGEQVYVPSREEVETGRVPAATQPSGGSQSAGSAAGVDINSAGPAELEALPGVGPATAEKIVADREANGPFASPEDIMRVPGIGEKKFESMRELIVVK